MDDVKQKCRGCDPAEGFCRDCRDAERATEAGTSAPAASAAGADAVPKKLPPFRGQHGGTFLDSDGSSCTFYEHRDMRQWGRECFDAGVRWASTAQRTAGGDAVAAILREVAELPDRDSPPDWPEAMLVTADELRAIIEKHIGEPVAEAAAQADGAPGQVCMMDMTTCEQKWVDAPTAQPRPEAQEDDVPVFGIGDRVVITDSFKHEGVIRRIYRDEIKAYNVVGDFGGGMYGAWELKHAEQEDEGDFARYSRAQLIAYICELREEEQAAPDVALELPDGEEATRSSQGCQCGQTHEWCKANECPALPAATAAAQPTLPDDERAAFFAWFAEHGGPYGSVKDAQDVFSAGYRAALRQPPAGGRGEDAERLSWLADRVLACDYGDNDDPGHRNGWYIRSDLIPIGGKAQAAFMYGKSISEAIDAARAAASPAQEKQAGEDA